MPMHPVCTVFFSYKSTLPILFVYLAVVDIDCKPPRTTVHVYESKLFSVAYSVQLIIKGTM